MSLCFLLFQTCPGKCTENKNCALCRAFQTGPLSAEECETKCSHVDLVPYIDKDVVIGESSVMPSLHCVEGLLKKVVII